MTQKISGRGLGLSLRGCLLVTAVCALALTGSVGSAIGSGARASRTMSLHESGSLHRTSHHGFTLNEVGSASGTIKGTIYIHLTITSTNRVTAEVNIYPSGGSITGYAKAAYRTEGATASFTGTMSVARGTGHYSHAHGSGLSFTGSIKRSNDSVSVHMNGNMSV
jgi:hypothetical protein